jgi:hypothetical protein
VQHQRSTPLGEEEGLSVEEVELAPAQRRPRRLVNYFSWVLDLAGNRHKFQHPCHYGKNHELDLMELDEGFVAVAHNRLPGDFVAVVGLLLFVGGCLVQQLVTQSLHYMMNPQCHTQ